MKMTTEEKIKIMQAFVDGKQVEYTPSWRYDVWEELENPEWNFVDFYYRIKQKEFPKIGSCIWVYDLKMKNSKSLVTVKKIQCSHVYVYNWINNDGNVLEEFYFDNDATKWSYFNV